MKNIYPRCYQIKEILRVFYRLVVIGLFSPSVNIGNNYFEVFIAGYMV